MSASGERSWLVKDPDLGDGELGRGEERGRTNRWMRMLTGGIAGLSDRLRHGQLPSRLPGGLVLAAAVATVVIASGQRLPFVVPMIGLWLVIGLPAQLIYAKVDWPAAEPSERFVYAVVTTLLLVMGVAIAFNVVLPYLGIERPLARGPVLVAADLTALALLAWRPDRWHWRPPESPGLLDATQGKDRLVVAGAAALVLLAVAGANRLNNGAGGSVSLVALVFVPAILVLLLVWRCDLRPTAIAVAIYLLSLAMLLLTSLRGWYVSGHDVQVELLMFRIATDYERWSMDYFHGAYFACLSITILPTVLLQMTGIADHYVYKVLIQLFFALCPVVVYLIARRFTFERAGVAGRHLLHRVPDLLERHGLREQTGDRPALPGCGDSHRHQYAHVGDASTHVVRRLLDRGRAGSLLDDLHADRSSLVCSGGSGRDSRREVVGQAFRTGT